MRLYEDFFVGQVSAKLYPVTSDHSELSKIVSCPQTLNSRCRKMSYRFVFEICRRGQWFLTVTMVFLLFGVSIQYTVERPGPMCNYIYSYGVVGGSATDNVIRNRFITKKT